MANRSYLYSTNFVPPPGATESQRRIIGISEWNYDVPLVFKLLLSGNPKKCRSLIWDMTDEIALVGDYEQGLARLFRFLDRISIPEIVPLRDEAREFLAAEKNRGQFFVLECGEIFEMIDEPLSSQNVQLLSEIQDIASVAEATVVALNRAAQSKSNRGLLARMLHRTEPASSQSSKPDIHAIGLGNWSNILFYDPNQE